MIERISGRPNGDNISKIRVSRRFVVGGIIAAGVTTTSTRGADLSTNYNRPIELRSLTAAQQVLINAQHAFNCQEDAALNRYLDPNKLAVRKLNSGWQSPGPPSIAALKTAMHGRGIGAKFVVTGFDPDKQDWFDPTITWVTGMAAWRDFDGSKNDALQFEFHVQSGKLIYTAAWEPDPSTTPLLPPFSCP